SHFPYTTLFRSEIEKQTDDQVVILKTAQCKVNFEESARRTVLEFEVTSSFDWVKSIYHLATSRFVLVDNYFGFLAAVRFRAGVEWSQLWHAAGAIKQFGLKDPSIEYRTERARRRFKKVYDRFDHVVVGSEKMARIFKESFGLSNERMLRTGIPRTDFYYDARDMERVATELQRAYPAIRDKKVMLYAPTFRDNALKSTELELDIGTLYRALGDEYVLLLRLHPAIQGNFNN